MEFHELNASEIVLVLANDSVYKLRSSDIPANIRSHTRCLHFANLDTVNQMLMDNLNFKKTISHVCAYPDELDKLDLARNVKPDFFKLKYDDILPLSGFIVGQSFFTKPLLKLIGRVKKKQSTKNVTPSLVI